MRLINVHTYELEEPGTVEYAILSHRWFEREITFRTFDSELGSAGAITSQEAKVRGACKQAINDGLDWIWIDSCCIDKSSSEELSRSVRSMFQWYQRAKVCYTYLQDVRAPEGTHGGLGSTSGTPSAWFTRGWTLQELLAPRNMRFYDSEWTLIGDKTSLAAAIATITGIDAEYLTRKKDFRDASIATRLSWQANRKTTEIEDMTYSLFGILEVAIVPMYGEGQEAFMRLQREIVSTRPDESIFAWTALTGSLPSHDRSQWWAPDQWGLLAPSPSCFRDSGDVRLGRTHHTRPAGSIAVTREGITFPVAGNLDEAVPMWSLALAWIPCFPLVAGCIRYAYRKIIPVPLNCWRRDPEGCLRPVQIYVSRDDDDSCIVWRRCKCSELGFAKDWYIGNPPNSTIIQPSGVRWPVDE